MRTLDKDIDMVRRGAAGIIAGAAVAGLMIGGLVGAVVALLYAPSSGEETRARMRGRAIELQDTLSQAKSKAAEMKQRAKTIADEKLG